MREVQPRTHKADDPDSLLVPDTDSGPRPFAVLNLILFQLKLLDDLIGQEPSQFGIRLRIIPGIQIGPPSPISKEAAGRHIREMSEVIWHFYS
jgi:hypothetical protein